MRVVKSSELASATVTESLMPSNDNALPVCPATRVGPDTVPGLPVPDASVAVAPLASLNAHAPTSPVAGGETTSVTGTSTGEPVAPAAVIRTLPVYVPRVSPAVVTATDTDAGAVPLAGVAASHDESSDVV